MTATATDVFWSGARGRDWHNAGSWVGGVLPTAGDVAVFDSSVYGNGCRIFQVGSRVEVAGLRFVGPSPAVQGTAVGNGALTIGQEGVAVSGGMVTLDLPLALGASQTWAVAGDSELLLSGALSGEGVLTKDGEGRAWLTGPGVFSGEYRVAAGTLRTSRDSAAPVTEGLAVWLDAAAADTVVTNGAGVMTAWRSRVGGGEMVATPGGGPLWVADAMAGKPAARFTNAWNQGMVMLSGYSNTTNCATAFIVAQRRSRQTDYTGLLSIYRGGELDYDQYHASVFFHFPGGFPHNSVKGFRRNVDGGFLSFPSEQPVCLMSRFNGASHVIARDYPAQYGTTSTHTNMFLPFDANRIVLANRAAPVNAYNYPFNGEISEMLLYNRVLTEAEERQVFAYLRGKWEETPPFTIETTLKRATVHFDAARPETLVTNAAGGVLAWTNLCNEGALVPQTAGQNPLYVTGESGGLPAVRFDKDLTNALQMLNVSYYGAKSATLFTVITPRPEQIQYTGVASFSRSTGNDYNEAGSAILLAFNNSNIDDAWWAHQENQWLGGGHLRPERVAVVMSSFDKGLHAMQVNGLPSSPPAVREVLFNAQNLRVGNRFDSSARTFNGDIHELMIFNCALSPEETAQVTEYLKAKWLDTPPDDLAALLAEAAVRFDASDAGSVTTNEFGIVTELRNLNATGAAEIADQAGCDGPLYVEGAMNGLPVLRFDHTRNTVLEMTSGYTNSNAFLTAFAVARITKDSGTTDAGLLSLVRSGQRDYDNMTSASVMLIRSSGMDRWGAHRAGRDMAQVNDVPHGKPFSLMSRFDGFQHTLELNGLPAAAPFAYYNNATTRFAADRIQLGGRQTRPSTDPNPRLERFLSCDLGEMLVFNRDLTPSETALIHSYLHEKWYPDTSANTLPELLARANVWLDASAAGTVTLSPGGLVTAWANRNGNTGALTPPPGCDGPALIADALNGLPVLRFDKDAATKQMLWVTSGYSLTTTAATAVIMMRPRAEQINNSRLLATWRDPNHDWNTPEAAALLYYTTGNARWQAHRNGSNKSFCANLPPEEPACLISRFDSVSHRIILNGTILCGVEPSTGAFNTDRFAIGGRRTAGNENEWHNGDVAEVLLYDYALSPDQYRLLASYLMAKWMPPPPPAQEDGTHDIQVCEGALLDARGAEGLTLPGGASLYGAGTIWGDVVMGSGSWLWASGNLLAIDGDLTLEQGARLAVDYSGGLRPLVSATGQLVLKDVNVTASAIREITGSTTLPILQGGTGWHDGNGNAPDPAGWTLTSDINGAAFNLDPLAYRVNIKFQRGTILMIR